MTYNRFSLWFSPKILIFFRILLLFTGSHLSLYPGEIILSDDISSLNIIKEMEILEDKEELFTIEDIITPAVTEKFVKSGPFESEDTTLWVKFRINNQSLYNRKWLLQYRDTSWDKTILVYRTGNDTHEPPGKQEIISYENTILSRKPTFMIDIPLLKHYTLYIRLQTETRCKLAFSIIRPEPFIHTERITQFLLGLEFGILILAVLYNLYIYISFKDLTYLYYILFIISFALYQLLHFGLMSDVLPVITGLEGRISSFLSLSALISGILFPKSFLNLKKNVPRLNRYINLIFIPCSLFAILHFTTNIFIFEVLLNLLLIIGMAGIYIMAIVLWIKGYKPARIYVIAVTIFIFLGIIQLLSGTGILPRFYMYTVDIGAVVMLVLFSVAFVDKINIILKEKAEAQKMAIENLHKADTLKDEFLANTSHELKTPLNGIIGITESLIDGVAGPIPAEVLYNLQLIFKSSKRLDMLISDLLDFSALKKNTIELYRTSVHLKSIVDDILTLLGQQCKAKGIQLTNIIEESVPPVYADENRVYQIFYNLISNGIKFTEKGNVVINASGNETYVEITVSDTGIGIPKDKIERIFDSFEQADSSIAREYGGAGLGLSITRSLVESHDGKIWVESRSGQGSKFYFTLPRAPEEIPVASAKKSTVFSPYPDTIRISPLLLKQKKDPDMKKPNILVVDDEPVNIQILMNFLVLNNYNVEYACCGKEALDLLHNQGKKYDAVLLDVMMPIMSGYELCKNLRLLYNSNQLPILFITVKNTPADIVRGLKAGANDYLSKPVSKTELLARLHTHLALKGLNNEIEETQREFILRVGTIAETRSRETGNHVKRVAKYSAILARKYNLSNEEITLLEFASPMHDIGKVGIPDAILNKPEELTPEEFEIMKKHTEIGYEMIGLSDKKLLRTAGIIALTHHEHWNGNGYPKGLQKDEIPIFGRITAVADVFDAVGSDRCYKKAWELEKILEHFRSERGKLFDPDLIDIFFDNLSFFLDIRKKYKDP